VKLAARGQRDMDTGPQPVSDTAELSALRGQARKVHLNSLLFAGALTAFLLLL
jgi:hypothetical protein